MPTHILTLKTYRTMAAAYDAVTALYAQFKAAHKRGEKVDLFIASSGDIAKPDIAIRVHYTRENEADARWFAEAVKAV